MLTCRVERECYPKVGKDTIKEIKLQKKKIGQIHETIILFFSLVDRVT